MVKLENGYLPETLAEALEIRPAEKVVPYAGGTDLMVEAAEEATYLFLNQLPELSRVRITDDTLEIGAACTYTELLNHEAVPQVLKDAMIRIASPATRNQATPAGNICNASPKADSALIFVAAGARLRLRIVSGERVVPISEFFIDRGKTCLREDELLTEILMPRRGLENYYYKKIGARAAMAISRVSFVAIYGEADGRIERMSIAFGAVSGVVLRFPEAEAMMIGRTIPEAKAMKADFLKEYDERIVPIRGRVSATYRKQACMNLLNDFLESRGI